MPGSTRTAGGNFHSMTRKQNPGPVNFDLFGNEVTIPTGTETKKDRISVRQYRSLLSFYGKAAGKKCGDCLHCVRHAAGSKKFYKCHKATIGGPATDWSSKWPACGLFTEKPTT